MKKFNESLPTDCPIKQFLTLHWKLLNFERKKTLFIQNSKNRNKINLKEINMADGFFDNCKIREHQSCLHLKWTSIPVFNQLSAVKILYNTFYSFLALKPQEIFEKSIKSPPTPILSNIPHQPSMFNGSTSMIPTHFHFLNNASDEKRYSI